VKVVTLDGKPVETRTISAEERQTMIDGTAPKVVPTGRKRKMGKGADPDAARDDGAALQ
jgi:hypothetical protein